MAKAWSVGRVEIARMVDRNELKRIAGADADGRYLMEHAHTTLDSARQLRESDPRNAITLAYDAARCAAEALLAQQGLRARSTDGHHALVQAAVVAQFGSGFDVFGMLRRRRHELEYPTNAASAASRTEADTAIADVHRLLDAAETLLPELGFWTQ